MVKAKEDHGKKLMLNETLLNFDYADNLSISDENVSKMYQQNNAEVKKGNGASSLFGIESGVKQGCVPSPFIWIILIDCPEEDNKGFERAWNEMGG